MADALATGAAAEEEAGIGAHCEPDAVFGVAVAAVAAAAAAAAAEEEVGIVHAVVMFAGRTVRLTAADTEFGVDTAAAVAAGVEPPALGVGPGFQVRDSVPRWDPPGKWLRDTPAGAEDRPCAAAAGAGAGGLPALVPADGFAEDQIAVSLVAPQAKGPVL